MRFILQLLFILCLLPNIYGKDNPRQPIFPDKNFLDVPIEVSSNNDHNKDTSKTDLSILFQEKTYRLFAEHSQENFKFIFEGKLSGKLINNQKHPITGNKLIHRFYVKSKAIKNHYFIFVDFVTYIPGVGIAGCVRPFRNDSIGDNNHRGIVLFLMNLSGELVFPENDEFVQIYNQHANKITADRVFYHYGKIMNLPEKYPFHCKKDTTTFYDNIKSSSFLFDGKVLENEWGNLQPLNHSIISNKFFRANSKGFIQFGNNISDDLVITTLTPELKVKNIIGPVVSMSPEFPNVSSKSTIKERGLEEMHSLQNFQDIHVEVFMVENLDLSGVFSILDYDGEFYIPNDALGFTPLLREHFGYLGTPKTGQRKVHFFKLYGMVVIYPKDEKFIYKYVSIELPKTDKLDEDLAKIPYFFSDYQVLYSERIEAKNMKISAFTKNPYLFLAKNDSLNNWTVLSLGTHGMYNDLYVVGEDLATAFYLGEMYSLQAIDKRIAYRKQQKEETRRYQEAYRQTEEYKVARAKLDKYVRERKAAQAAAAIEKQIRREKAKNSGFSYGSQTSSRYRQTVERSVRNSVIPTTTILQYQNGKIIRTY